MKITNQTNAGWIIVNGSGWNSHKTAGTLEAMLADAPETLPTVPPGYAVLVAPISDRPFGLRCALVKALARKVEVIDGQEYDDGPNDNAGEQDQWAWNTFGCEVERLYSCKEYEQSCDSSAYFIARITEVINNEKGVQ